MAKKAVAGGEAPAWLTAEHQAALTAGGIDWKALLLKLGSAAIPLLLMILQSFGLPVTPPAGKAQAAPGCCDHTGLCHKVMTEAGQTFHTAALHYHECCCETVA